MEILAIDPGDKKSAFVHYCDGVILQKAIVDNVVLLVLMTVHPAEIMAIEMIASYGMPVGKTVFETCVWIGRFIQAWKPKQTNKIYRLDVKMHLCHSARAKDGNIRQALLDKFPSTGGGKTPQIGTKKQPGPLYGVSKDIWSALAVAVTYEETQLTQTKKEIADLRAKAMRKELMNHGPFTGKH